MSWACCARSPGPGCRTTTPTPRHCSAPPNTGPTTPVGPLPVKRRPAGGQRHSWTGTPISTDTAPSGSLPRSSGTAPKPRRSATSARRSMSRPGSAIPDVGQGPFAAGVNPSVAWINEPQDLTTAEGELLLLQATLIAPDR